MPLQVTEHIVKYEFIRMPDSTGYGNDTERCHVIPVSLQGIKVNYTLTLHLDDHAPIAGGREIEGFPKKYTRPHVDGSLPGFVSRSSIICATSFCWGHGPGRAGCAEAARHALAPVARTIKLSASHYFADLTLTHARTHGQVVYDYPA